MSAFLIEGGSRLSGSVAVQGAKNSVLPILAATILSGGISVIHNCPQLTDVDASIAILRHLGCVVHQDGGDITVDSGPMNRCDVPDRLMREMRSSVVFLGAILGRMGCAELSMPGGCELGPRPIDLHLAALKEMGASVEGQGGSLNCCCQGSLQGREIVLSIASVGATENIMLAACRAEGTTVISNAAREPEIMDLQQFLRAAGADVTGAGSSTVVIRGGHPLHQVEHTIIADRIVAATYLSAAAAAGGEVELIGVDRRYMLPVLEVYRMAGCEIHTWPDRIQMACPDRKKAVRPIRTAPYPGFPTDAQPPVLAALCTAEGTSVFVETIFENRFRHCGELLRMGADIRVEGRVAVICGVKRLQGTLVHAPDLRGGAALVVAALGAEGASKITGLSHIDRGYSRLPQDLRQLGANICRRDDGD